MIFRHIQENETVVIYKENYLPVWCEIILDFKKIKWESFSKTTMVKFETT